MSHESKLPAAALAMAVLASPAQGQLPDPGLTIDPSRTALVVTDPQNDFLSPTGVTWGLVGKSVTANHTVENIEALLKTAKQVGLPVFVSPHYYFPTDHEWKFGGAVEVMMHGIHMFDRKGQLTVEGFRGSGADWLERYKPYLEDGKTVVASPHKVYGPQNNDLGRIGRCPHCSCPGKRSSTASWPPSGSTATTAPRSPSSRSAPG